MRPLRWFSVKRAPLCLSASPRYARRWSRGLAAGIGAATVCRPGEHAPGVCSKKGRRLRARRGALSVGHGLTVPPFWVGASLLCSSGIFPRPRIAGRIGRPLYSRTHSPGTPCGCSDFPGAYNRQGRAVSGGLYGARPQCWGLGTPSPSLKRAEG